MTTFIAGGKPTYVYRAANDSWYTVGAQIDTAAGYEWGGAHTFLNATVFYDSVIAQEGFNNFLNYAARDAQIPSPTSGTTCFVRQDNSGNIINVIQFYSGTAWVSIISNTVVDAKGDLLVGLADDVLGRLPAGIDGQFLSVNSNEVTGLEWVDNDPTPTVFLHMGA